MGMILACFSDGLHHYDCEGKPLPRLATPEPCRLVSQSFDGERLLVAGMGKHIFCLDRAGQVQCRHSLAKPVTAMALSPRGEAAYVAIPGGEVMKLRAKPIGI
jgi:hypothetical protein